MTEASPFLLWEFSLTCKNLISLATYRTVLRIKTISSVPPLHLAWTIRFIRRCEDYSSPDESKDHNFCNSLCFLRVALLISLSTAIRQERQYFLSPIFLIIFQQRWHSIVFSIIVTSYSINKINEISLNWRG